MAIFSFDSDAATGAHSSVAATIARIQTDAAALMGQLTALQQTWGGQASVAFQSVASEWRGTQQRVEQNIEAINQALAAATRQYADVEMANARMFQMR